jgi:hypothetical protein
MQLGQLRPDSAACSSRSPHFAPAAVPLGMDTNPEASISRIGVFVRGSMVSACGLGSRGLTGQPAAVDHQSAGWLRSMRGDQES